MNVRRVDAVVEIELDEIEATILLDLVGRMCELLQEHTDGAVPADPVLARLLPPAHHDDRQLASEHRNLTEVSLRAEKRGAAEVMLAGLPVEGGVVCLDPDDVDPWLRAITDVRLMMGVELGITEDTEPPLRVRSQRDVRLSVYYWVTYLQDRLVEVAL